MIDKFVPEWQFRETLRIAALAPPEAIGRALREVTLRDLFRGLKLAPNEPMLNVLQRRGFVSVANEPREIVLGRERTRSEPVRVFMSCRIETTRLAMCVVTIETRVWTQDARARRNFAFYWWTIRLGSSLMRRMWLRAIRRRAEKIGS